MYFMTQTKEISEDVGTELFGRGSARSII